MAASDSGQDGLYEPLLPPYQDLTTTNRGPVALVVATTFLIITSLTVTVKVYTMYATSRKLVWSDGMMILALCFGIGYTICVCLAVNSGLGRVQDELDDELLGSLAQNYYAMNILFILSLACAKAAVTLLVVAIKPSKLLRQVAYGILGFTAAWGISSTFALAFQCEPYRQALGPSGGDICVNQYAMQAAIRAIDIVIDIAIVVLPIFMMQTVQVPQRKRFMVMILFGLRLATPICTAVSISVLHDFYDASLADRPSHAIVLSVWTTVSLNLSIITACIPFIKRFLADWAAGISAATISDPFEHEHSAGKSGSQTQNYGTGSGVLSSKIASRLGLNSANRTQLTSGNSVVAERSRPQYESQIHARTTNRRPSETGTSNSERGLIDGVIMHTTDYTVEYEERPNDATKAR